MPSCVSKIRGAGIAPKNIDRIFDRFTRIAGVAARTNEGTGIGLALVRELVEAHGGTVKVKSTEGSGSEFIVSIPKGRRTSENQPMHELQEPHTAKTTERLLKDDYPFKTKQNEKEGASRIIIVEDNADMREYLSSVLSNDGHKIFLMEDGQEVITFLENGGQADLILSDVMMLVLDGLGMLKKLKSNPKLANIPIILLTAKTTEESKIEALRLGAKAYLTKPFSAKELRAIIRLTLKDAQ